MICMTEQNVAEMSAKLVVRKFDSDIQLKSLQITITESENGSIKTKYSQWSNGNTEYKKKDTERSPRLIVKIVSGLSSGIVRQGSSLDFDPFDLDSCAQEIQNPEDYFKNNLLDYPLGDGPQNTDDKVVSASRTNTVLAYQQDARNSRISVLENLMTPLEYSLEKVKENNARIMENIQILNRTLRYTKQKETLDIVYPKPMRYSCATCGKCFVYETGLKRHNAIRHSVADTQPRWQVVWTCIECSQVWPQKELALKHFTKCCNVNNVADFCVREIKTSSLLQCEFCEKVYTSIPILLRHSKIHTIANNYECNACESKFQSYQAAEQHWLLCPWLKMCYSFSLPKLLLCNACDRKFKNYDQLYNHRYKAGHFMSKAHYHNNGVTTLGALVYQCEICGQSFSTIQTLQIHRSKNHTNYDIMEYQADTYYDE